MNFSNTKELSFKKMDNLIKKIFLIVRKDALCEKIKNHSEVTLCEDDLNIYQSTEQTLTTIKVKQTLYFLNKEQFNFIVKEYYKNLSNWWIDYYSRSTYYRKKKETMKIFIELYQSLC